MRLKHITPSSKTQLAAQVLVCLPTTGKFRISRGMSQRENRRKNE
jgi:hypothetical protein